MADIIDFQTEKIIKAVEEQSDITEDNSNLREAIQEARERNDILVQHLKNVAENNKKQGLEPNPCFNSVCEKHKSIFGERTHYCEDEYFSHGCLFRMLESPPNSLNYSGYMPTHKEALDMLEKNGLLKGDKSEYQDIFEEYKKCKTQEERKNVVLDGVTIHQAGKALDNVLDGIIIFFKNNNQKEVLPSEIFENEKDLIVRNFQIELEKVLGVYPNIIPLEF